MGGECNYLLRVAGPDKRLQFVPDSEWKSPFMQSWTEPQCQRLLDDAERLLLEGAHRLRLPVQVVRKERAVGVVPAAATIYEVLEELAITVQNQLQAELPFCAFNGGNDVFVDVGNKSLGLEALMCHLGCSPSEVLHVGDRFSDTGNDSATRDCCSILWVANPEETDFFIKLLLNDLMKRRINSAYIE
jgi:IMP and pyridine-specific 5'-nucleotidase